MIRKTLTVSALVLAVLLVVSAAGCSSVELTQQKSGEITLPEETLTEALPESAQAEPELPVRESALEEMQTLHERLFYASVCTCLMEESAHWRLLKLGIETDAPGDVFFGAMDAFGRALSAYPGDTFMDDAFWLIDTEYQGLELQFWKYNSSAHPGSLSCTAAFYWEPGMTDADLLGEDLLLYTLDWASCTKDASEEERTRVQEQYERLLPDFSSGTGWRVSHAPDGTLALTALDPEHGASIYYAHDVMYEPMIFCSEDLLHFGDMLTTMMTLTVYDLCTSPSGEKTYTLSAEDTAALEELFSIDSMTPAASDSESACAYQFDIGNCRCLLDESLALVDAIVRESEESHAYYRKRLSDTEIASLKAIIEAYAK